MAGRLLALVAGTALGMALLVLLLRSVNLDQLGSDFSDVDYVYLALAVPPFAVNLLAKVPRWRLLFGEEAPGWDTLFGAMNVGYSVNALLPLRLGEIVRAYWVRDRSGIGMMRTLSTILVERVTDGVTLFILLLVMLPTVAFPGDLIGPAALVGGAFIGALALMVLLAHAASHGWAHRLVLPVQRLGGRWAIAGQAIRQVMMGLQALRSRRALLLLTFYTLLIWASNTLLVWLVLRAFHIEVPLTAGILLSSVLNLGMAVPSAPGYVGVFDGLMVLTLGLYGVHRTPALAAALAFHAIAFVPVTIIGVIYMLRSGLRITLHLLGAPSPPNPGGHHTQRVPGVPLHPPAGEGE